MVEAQANLRVGETTEVTGSRQDTWHFFSGLGTRLSVSHREVKMVSPK